MGTGDEKPKKILVRAPNWIGDHVMAQAFYRGLRSGFADAHITVLTVDGISDPLFDCFDEHWKFSRSKRHHWGENLRWARKINQAHFDLAINLPVTVSAAFLLWLARVPKRMGYSADGSQCMLTQSKPWKGRDSGKHKSELYSEILNWMGLPAAKLSAPVRHESKPYIVLAPEASIELRQWPYFTKLCDSLRREAVAYEVIVTGTRRDSHWYTELHSVKGWTDKVGGTSLSELVELMQGASVVIGNDSGAVHLAASVAGTPTVVLYGPGDPKYIRPLGDQVYGAAIKGLSCQPCESATCKSPHGYKRCLIDLSVEQVIETVKTALEQSKRIK